MFVCVILCTAILALAGASKDSPFQRTLGVPCMAHWDCDTFVPNSECVGGLCQCQDGYITQDARCMIHTNNECPGTTPASTLCADPHASCVPELIQYPSGWWGNVHNCRCDDGWLHDADSDQCRRKLGQTCDAEVPCVAGECNAATNLCSCAGFFVPSTDGLTCLAGLGAICSQIECADTNAVCVISICECAEDFQSSVLQGDERPTCRKRLGAQCALTSDCALENSSCLSKLLTAPEAETTACVCEYGYVPSPGVDSCLPVQGILGGACSTSAQCTVAFGRHSACTGGACACAASHAFDWQTSSCVRT